MRSWREVSQQERLASRGQLPRSEISWTAFVYVAWRACAHDLLICVACLAWLVSSCFEVLRGGAKKPRSILHSAKETVKIMTCVNAVCKLLTWTITDSFVHLGWLLATCAEIMFTRFSSDKEACLQRVQRRAALALVCQSCSFFMLSAFEETFIFQLALIKLSGLIPFLILSVAYAYIGGLRDTNMVKGYMVIILAYSADAGACICSSTLYSLVFLAASRASSCFWLIQYGLAFAEKGLSLGISTGTRLQRALFLSFSIWVIGAVGQFLCIVGLVSTSSLSRFLCIVEVIHIIGASHLITKRKDVLRKADLQAEFPCCLEEKSISAGSLNLVVQLQELQEGATIVVCNSAISGAELTRIRLSDRRRQTVENFRMHVCNQLSVNPSNLRLISPSGILIEDKHALFPISSLLAPAQMDQGQNGTDSAKTKVKALYTSVGGA